MSSILLETETTQSVHVQNVLPSYLERVLGFTYSFVDET